MEESIDTEEDSKKSELTHCLFWIRDRSGFPIFPIIVFFFSKYRDTKLTSVSYSVSYLFLFRLLLSPPPPPLSPL